MTETTLWDYREDGDGTVRYGTNQDYTLRHSIDEYDVLVVELISHSTDVTLPDNHRSTNQLWIDVAMLADAFNPYHIAFTSYDTRCTVYYIHDDAFSVSYTVDPAIHGTLRVIGIKYS